MSGGPGGAIGSHRFVHVDSCIDQQPDNVDMSIANGKGESVKA